MAKSKEELAARRREIAEKKREEQRSRKAAYAEKLRRELNPDRYKKIDEGAKRISLERAKSPIEKKKDEIRARMASKMKPQPYIEKVNMGISASKSKARYERRHNKAPRTTLEERQQWMKKLGNN